MRRRHPHLFGLGEREPWETIKARERGADASVLDGLPSGLHPLLRAYRIQQRASAVGFDWDDPAGALAKVLEELAEVKDAHRAGDSTLQEELGDLLFSVVNVARLMDVDPTEALADANRKFARRFRALEVEARAQDLSLTNASLEELDRIWDAVKDRERP
jgi:MazG family protein